MLLVIPGRAVLRVFAITGVDRIIPNFTTLEEAPRANLRQRIQQQLASQWRT
jgi:hypothetical protein